MLIYLQDLLVTLKFCSIGNNALHLERGMDINRIT